MEVTIQDKTINVKNFKVSPSLHIKNSDTSPGIQCTINVALTITGGVTDCDFLVDITTSTISIPDIGIKDATCEVINSDLVFGSSSNIEINIY